MSAPSALIDTVAEQKPNSGQVLTSMQGRSAFELWTRQQWIALAHHLHNQNPPNQWVMAFYGKNYKNGGRPEDQYRKSKTKSHVIGIPWAWSSLCGKGKKKIAFTPYSQNKKEESRWAAIDFDAHSDDPEAAQNAFARAFKLFISILDENGIHVVLESSGRGWHVWMISKTFRPITEWIDFMQAKLEEVELLQEVEQGVIELFPRKSDFENECGFAMRAPGSWHPKTDKVNLILWEDVTPLLDELVALNIENRKAVSRKRKKYISLAPSSSYDGDVVFLYPRLLAVLDKYQIQQPNTRHKKLGKLVGELFYQVSETMAERFILEQYKQKQVATEASEQDHVEEFGSLWAGFNRRWLSDLSENEAEAFHGLQTDVERDAFKIIHSYARNAQQNDKSDFAIGRDDLGTRLAITGQGAGKLIERFRTLNIIERVRHYVPHKYAARYSWRIVLKSKKKRKSLK